MKYLPNIVREFCPSIVDVATTSASVKASSAKIPAAAARQKVDAERVKKECTDWLDRYEFDVTLFRLPGLGDSMSILINAQVCEFKIEE